MMDPELLTRLRCDLCGALVTKITNCPCGCGVATCGKCGTYYHIVARKNPLYQVGSWWKT